MLGRISTLLDETGANILEVSHRRTHLDIPAKGAQVEIMTKTRNGNHIEKIVSGLTSQGFVTRIIGMARI